MTDDLLQDRSEMEEAMSRLAVDRDTWQGAIMYALCKAVFHLLGEEIKRKRKGQ
ncbi:MAG: hypothetical protein IKT98_03870 [Selenomonadaceae bacterium]|nr:hypothetical protein [Selenomonadaceae bacterium]